MARIARKMDADGALAIVMAAAFSMAPISAHAQIHQIDLSAQDLASALSQLAHTENLELLFDQPLVTGKIAGAVHGATSAQQALDQLLRGTGLAYRQTAAGTFVIFNDQTRASTSRPEAPLAIEEILVVGRRTQNTDIRRSIDDIQPYQVSDSGAIDNAQPATVEDFLRTHQSSNTLAFALDQDPINNTGSTRSLIDLRGLGPDQTLVLVDGRRLSSIPQYTGFTQSDLNGLSPGTIDRIETLGSSTGGIFGIGAAGGVVNVVLKRDFEGAAFSATNGISAQGDAWRWVAEGRLGFTNASTGTRAMLHVGHSQDDGLAWGDLDFVLRARQLQIERSPDRRVSLASPSINFVTNDGSDLILKPAFGGGSLGTSTTFLPLDAPPIAAGGLDILKANAGQYDTALSPDGQGTEQSLINSRRATSVLATIRQKVAPWLEAYLDLLWLQDDGSAAIAAGDTAHNQLQSGSPANPFNVRQSVNYSFPTPGLVGSARTLTVTDRMSAGLIVRLGGDWSANLDAALGEARISSTTAGFHDSTLIVDPFLGAAAFAAQIASLHVEPLSESRHNSRLNDFNLRLGGPLLDLPGGPLTLTAAGEFFREINTGLRVQEFAPPGESALSHTRRDVTSLFFEARAPLVPTDSAFAPLRGLELQLALRGDRYVLTAPGLPAAGSLTPSAATTVSNRGEIFARTFGAKVTPIPALTLRGSVSTGFTPPTSVQIIDFRLTGILGPSIVDPKRGGPQPFVTRDDQYTVSLLGSSSLGPQKTTTLSGGVILRPDFVPGLRLSLDYTRLSTNKEITDFAQGNLGYFIDNEARYPGRIVRTPLAAEDAALGYTGGKITHIDASSLQTGRSVAQAVDFSLDYVNSSDLGTFHVVSQITWEPSFERQGDPTQPAYNLVDHADGLLSWRGNTGVTWSRGDWMTGLNLQFYSAYSGYLAKPQTEFVRIFLASVGDTAPPDGTNASYIPPQFYLDWLFGLRSELHLLGSEPTIVEYRFGIKNVLDFQPPVVAGTFAIKSKNNGVDPYDYNPLGGYGGYGDPRGRRFALTISAAL
jgi:outer membrane receptor protein involved in Fe transport